MPPESGSFRNLAEVGIDLQDVLGFRFVVRFAAVRLVAAVVAALILGAAFEAVTALPWNPLQGLSHSCPPGSSLYDCVYPARAAWVLPAGVAIGLIGLGGASGVLRAASRHNVPERTTEPRV
jgi:hypothetical protein